MKAASIIPISSRHRTADRPPKPVVIEVSGQIYDEIWEILAQNGYDWLVFPDVGQIPMTGFVIRRVK